MALFCGTNPVMGVSLLNQHELNLFVDIGYAHTDATDSLSGEDTKLFFVTLPYKQMRTYHLVSFRVRGINLCR